MGYNAIISIYWSQKYNYQINRDEDWFGASLLAQMVKNLPAMQELGVRALGREYPLEKDPTNFSILAWGIP